MINTITSYDFCDDELSIKTSGFDYLFKSVDINSIKIKMKRGWGREMGDFILFFIFVSPIVSISSLPLSLLKITYIILLCMIIYILFVLERRFSLFWRYEGSCLLYITYRDEKKLIGRFDGEIHNLRCSRANSFMATLCDNYAGNTFNIIFIYKEDKLGEGNYYYEKENIPEKEKASIEQKITVKENDSVEQNEYVPKNIDPALLWIEWPDFDILKEMVEYFARKDIIAFEAICRKNNVPKYVVDKVIVKNKQTAFNLYVERFGKMDMDQICAWNSYMQGNITIGLSQRIYMKSLYCDHGISIRGRRYLF